MITREFNLYLHAGHSIPLVINVNQYDRGETWVFTLFNSDGTQYIPSSGAIVGIKSDNLGIINSGTVDASGRVVINETQQMTAAVGKAVFELLIDDQTHGTANFIVLVEPKPGDNADLSESDYSLFQQAIDGTSAAAIAEGVADWMDENLTPTSPVVDASLTVQGAAADAKKTGDEIFDLKSQIQTIEAIPYEVKIAMDTLFSKLAVKDDDGYSSEYAIIHSWATTINIVSISAVFNQGSARIYDDASLDSLKAYLTVTATYADESTAEVTSYTLSGDLNSAVSTITVSYGGLTTTFTVDVTLAVFDYDSARDGLPTTLTGITRSTNSDAKWTETLDNNLWKIVGTGTADNYLYYKIGETPTTGKWRLVINAKINAITTAGTTQALGIRPQISDGSGGARFGCTQAGHVLANKSSTTLTDVGSIQLGDVWHTLEARLDASAPNQKIIIDGTTLVNASTLGTSAKYNAIFFVASCVVYVKSIKLYNLTEPSESEE